MSKDLSIIMYHYVRPIKTSKFPGLKGREVSEFCSQLDYLEENYNFVSVDEINFSIKTGSKLRPNACWLTFDDGYKDHIQYVLPALKKRGIQGSFFPPSRAVANYELLDVNAIHFIIAAGISIAKLVEMLDTECIENGVSTERLKEFKRFYGKPNRWDRAETIYFKRMLQHVLAPDLRGRIITGLLMKVLGVSAPQFARDLYMNTDELRTLVSEGMYVGSHGAKHLWLDKSSKEEQMHDINESLKLLEEIKAPTKDWVMCYPYGAYNSDSVEILKKLSCSIGITTKPRLALLGHDSQFELPRFDTNDFPI
jgi:peptidoglycan/xylan/chitin deacetylase (PgdA/CDA1 family)